MGYYDFKAQGASGKAFYLGELAHGSTMDISAKYDDYANLTADNFLIVPQSAISQASAVNYQHISRSNWDEQHDDFNRATYTAPSISYAPSTGQLSFTSTLMCDGVGYLSEEGEEGSWSYTRPESTTGLTAKVYLVTGIEAL